jgi:methionine-R-sulfoxide reductase
LSPEQFKILKKNGTEAPFANDYWNNKRRGLYVDVISGEPLFSSEDKFDSGSGWPSFTKALKPEAVQKKSDTSHGMQRIEVRSAKSDSHLGHVFDDGPKDRGGLRYCINSASLRFVPYEELDAQGYAAWKPVFDSPKK